MRKGAPRREPALGSLIRFLKSVFDSCNMANQAFLNKMGKERTMLKVDR